MSTTHKGQHTETVTDSYDQPFNGHSIAGRHIANQEAVNERVTAFVISTPPLQQQPNDRFYCTNNQVEDRRSLDSDKVDWNFRWSEEDDVEEKLPWKQVAEVAAAARFIAKADVIVLDKALNTPAQTPPKPRLGSTTKVRDSILESSLHIPKSRSAGMQHSYTFPRKMSARRPPPLQLGLAQTVPEEIQSPLPQRISSKGAPSFDVARPLDFAQQPQTSLLSPSLTSDPKTSLTVLTPASANSFDFDFGNVNEPRLSRSGSGATTDPQSPTTPDSETTEDQIRREIEAFALEQGPHLRGTQRRTRRPPILNTSDQSIDADQWLPRTPKREEHRMPTPAITSPTTIPILPEDSVSHSPILRRKKSIFGWLQKRPEVEVEVEVDDLIDLYLTDEQRGEVKAVKPKASRPKLTIFRNRVATDPGPIRAS